MRGLRRIGNLEIITDADFDDDSLLFFGPYADGTSLRSGWYRGRFLKGRELSMLQHMLMNGVVKNDYVFVATAIGEECFK